MATAIAIKSFWHDERRVRGTVFDIGDAQGKELEKRGLVRVIGGGGAAAGGGSPKKSEKTTGQAAKSSVSLAAQASQKKIAKKSGAGGKPESTGA